MNAQLHSAVSLAALSDELDGISEVGGVAEVARIELGDAFAIDVLRVVA